MDKQTEIMWEEEFLKQYPLTEETAEQKVAQMRANREVYKAVENSLHSRVGEYTRQYMYMMYNSPSNSIARQHWYNGCKQRFEAIFSAQPVYALEELRKGNLLIEENI